MKLCIISRTYHPLVSGPATVAQQLAENLPKDWEVHIVTQGTKELKRYERRGNVHIHRVNLSFLRQSDFGITQWIFGSVFLARRAVQVMLENKIKVVHVMDISIAAFAGFLAKFFCWKAKFLIRHGGDLAFEVASAKRLINWDLRKVENGWKLNSFTIKLAHFVQKFYLKRYDYVLAICENSRDLLMKMGVSSKKRIKTQQYCIDFDKFSKIKESKSEEITLVTVGRMHYWRGFQIAVKAMTEAKDAKLIVVGDGFELPRLRQLAKSLNVEDRVIFLGKKTNPETLKIMASAHAFVSPCYPNVGVSNVVLEAMALGVPVIASRIPGQDEYFKHNESVLFFEMGDADGLAEQINLLIKNKSLQEKLSKNAETVLKEKFSVERMVKSMVDVYLRLANI